MHLAMCLLFSWGRNRIGRETTRLPGAEKNCKPDTGILVLDVTPYGFSTFLLGAPMAQFQKARVSFLCTAGSRFGLRRSLKSDSPPFSTGHQGSFKPAPHQPSTTRQWLDRGSARNSPLVHIGSLDNQCMKGRTSGLEVRAGEGDSEEVRLRLSSSAANARAALSIGTVVSYHQLWGPCRSLRSRGFSV